MYSDLKANYEMIKFLLEELFTQKEDQMIQLIKQKAIVYINAIQNKIKEILIQKEESNLKNIINIQEYLIVHDEKNEI